MTIDYRDFEPMHKFEYINDLWDFERTMMSNEELRTWAELGFKSHLDKLNEDQLKARYADFQALVALSEDIKDAM